MVCFNCGTFFPEDEIVEKPDGETARHLCCCPHCGADDIGDSGTCRICGREFPADELINGVCDNCMLYFDPPR